MCGKIQWFVVLIAVIFVSASCVHESLAYKTDPYRHRVASADIPPGNEDRLGDVSRYRNDTPSARAASLPEGVSESVFENPQRNLPALVQEMTRGEDDEFQKVKNIHAWNAVRIGKAWYLVDVTWDAGYLSGSGSFVTQYETSYLFIPPRGMIYTHFPENETYQLLNDPVTERDFRDLPYLTGKYYMVFDGPPKGLKRENSAESGTVIQLPPHGDDYVVRVSIISQREKERFVKEGSATTRGGKYVYVERTPDATLAHVRFPETGTCYVTLGARKRRAEGVSYTHITEFQFNVERACDTFFPNMGFRETFDYTLHEPIRNPLKVGEKVRFSIHHGGQDNRDSLRLPL